MNYKEQKLTKEDIVKHPEFKDLSNDEIEELSDMIFDFAITVKQMVMIRE